MAVRRILATPSLVGLSCHDIEEVARADANPAVDWVAIGPVFATASKRDSEPVVGLEGVGAARAATSKPLVAIGGVTASRIPRVLEAGADAVVVLSALVAGGCSPAAIEQRARALVEIAGASRESAS
jgi:thiamine-phosphate pyrophosphorylase